MSSYLVLARKYRPRSFPELVGQEVVTSILDGALQEGRIGHAYLFSGPRGTGKTTTARILAKCLNCESGPTPTPCGTCPRCQAADAGNEPDIIELDAASHTGVDHIRSLRDEVAYAPLRARHKVYIVDEVHMLSKAAFNALLKTLEEPPAHVVFLFATTEPHKVLDTILSRCQVLRLDPISEENIARRLEEVFAAEGVRAEPGVVAELARAARGGMRDALSLADKLLALAGDAPTLTDMQRLGGGGGTRALEELLDAIERGDRAGVLAGIAAHDGGESELASGLLERLRTAVVLAHCGVQTPLVAGTPEERAAARERAERLGAERIELWMQELLRAKERMRAFAGQERVVLEVALLELARPETSIPLGELVARFEALAASLAGGAPLAPPPTPLPPVARASAGAPEASPRNSPAVRGGSAGSAGSAARAPLQPHVLWSHALEQLATTHGAFSTLLTASARIESLLDGGLEVHLSALDEKSARLAHDRRSRAALDRALAEVAGRPVTLRWAAAVGDPAPPGPRAAATPARTRAPASEAPLQPAAEPSPGPRKAPSPSKAPDPLTQKVADLFGGVIEEL